jgi:hypothetical protein
MKVSDSALDMLRGRIAPLDTEETRTAYRAGEFFRSDLVKDLDKRYRWDLFWAAGGHRLLDALPPDVTDAHLDTALRRIVAPL